MDELISVIIPVYNVEKYLRRCLESVSKQTYKNLQIILIDDGSTDQSGTLCDKFAEGDQRVEVIHQMNGGLSAARNRGIECASSEYLIFIDSDDCVHTQFIELLYHALLLTNADISECMYQRFNEFPTEKKEVVNIPSVYSGKDALNLLVGEHYEKHVVAWNKLYKKGLFKNLYYPVGKLHEDEFTTYKLFYRATKVAVIPNELYYYYYNNDSITTKKIKPKRLDAMDAIIERFEFYDTNEYKELCNKTAVQLFQLIANFEQRKPDEFDEFSEFQRIIKIKYKKCIDIFKKSNLKWEYKLWIQLGKANIKIFSYYNRVSYYLNRAKDKVYLGCKKIIVDYNRKKGDRQRRRRQETELKKFSEELEKTKRAAIVLGGVEYANLGDQAICLAQKEFISTYLPVFEISDSLFRGTREKLKEIIRFNDVIIIPGGGNMGDVWRDDEERRRWIIQDYPSNKIIVFPQTLDYSKTELGEDSLETSQCIYNKHERLVLCAREQKSYQWMKKLYINCKVLLVPDIVLSLKRSFPDIKRKGVLVCMRNDVEKKIDDKFIERVVEYMDSQEIEYSFTDTVENGNLYIDERDFTVTQKIKQFASASLVLTDRLHGMIFAAITGTNCIVFSNSNHKVSGVYSAWLKEEKNIYFKEQYEFEEIENLFINCNQSNIQRDRWDAGFRFQKLVEEIENE